MNKEIFKQKITEYVLGKSKYIHWLLYNAESRYKNYSNPLTYKSEYYNPKCRVLSTFNVEWERDTPPVINVWFQDESSIEIEFIHKMYEEGRYARLDSTFNKDVYFEKIEVANNQVIFGLRTFKMLFTEECEFHEVENHYFGYVIYDIERGHFTAPIRDKVNGWRIEREHVLDYHNLPMNIDIQLKIEDKIRSLIASEGEKSVSVVNLKRLLDLYQEAYTDSKQSRMVKIVSELYRSINKDKKGG